MYLEGSFVSATNDRHKCFTLLISIDIRLKLRIIIILYAVHRVVLGDAGFFDYLPESLQTP